MVVQSDRSRTRHFAFGRLVSTEDPNCFSKKTFSFCQDGVGRPVYKVVHQIVSDIANVVDSSQGHRLCGLNDFRKHRIFVRVVKHIAIACDRPSFLREAPNGQEVSRCPLRCW
jgi:hypothetical protein